MKSHKSKQSKRTWTNVFSLLFLAILVLATLSLSCTSNTATPVVSCVQHINDSSDTTVIRLNDPNSFREGWICVSPGEYLRLVRVEGWAIENGLEVTR